MKKQPFEAIVVQALAVAVVLTLFLSSALGVASISDNCSALVGIRGVGGNAGPDLLERDYAPACYPETYLPSCLPNNIPIYGGSSVNPQYGTFAPPAPICGLGLEVCSSWDKATGCTYQRARPLCPEGKNELASTVGCAPRATATPSYQVTTNPYGTPVPIYGQSTPTAGAAPTDAIPSSALPTLTPSPTVYGSATVSAQPTAFAPSGNARASTKDPLAVLAIFLTTFILSASFLYVRKK